MKAINSKNCNVELLRIFLTVAICLHHFRLYSDELPYGGGYIAVDCFLVISGYYMGEHIYNAHKKEKNVWNYIWKRWKRLYPDYIFAFGISFLIRIITGEFVQWKAGNLREALMIEIWCVNIEDRVNPPDWYCGYLILASGVLYLYIQYVSKQKFAKCVTGIISAFMYLILLISFSYTNIYPKYQTTLSIAIVRTLAGLLLGYFVYLLAGKTYGIMKKHSRLFELIIVSFLVIGLCYIMLWDNSIPYIDYFAILLFVVLFYFMVETPIEYKNALFKTIIAFMGELCYVAYLNHYLVAFIFNKYSFFRVLDWKVISILFLMSVFIFSVIVYELQRAIRAIGLRVMSRLRKNGEVR